MKTPRQPNDGHRILLEHLEGGHYHDDFTQTIRSTLNKQELQRAIATGIVSHYLTPEHYATYGVQVAPLVVTPEKQSGLRSRFRSHHESRLLIGKSVTKRSISVGRTLDYADWSRVREFPGRTVRFGNHTHAFPLSYSQIDAASQPYLLSNGYIGESLPLTEDGKPRISSELGPDSADGRFLQSWTRPDYSTDGPHLPVVEAFNVTAETYYDPERFFSDLGRIVAATL